MLQRALRAQVITLRYWGQASSGLARPDHHDWIAVTPGLMADLRPDVVIVGLGVNDSQSLWNDGQWIPRDDARWEEVYARRVDALLERAAGPERERLVVWLGPYAYVDWRAEDHLPIVARLQRERIAEFAARGGRAVYIDVYRATLGDDGRPLREATLGEEGEPVAVRTEDGIHLTPAAVRWFMAAPVLAAILPCLGGGGGAERDEDTTPSAEARPRGDADAAPPAVLPASGDEG